MCRTVEPPLRKLGPDQFAACHFPVNAPPDAPADAEVVGTVS